MFTKMFVLWVTNYVLVLMLPNVDSFTIGAIEWVGIIGFPIIIYLDGKREAAERAERTRRQ